MTIYGPEFQNISRPAYELPTLLARLGVTPVGRALTDDQRHLAQAIARHASNATETILDGIESVCHLLMSVALADQVELNRTHVANVGFLLTHLAVEAQAMRDTESDMRCMLTHVEPGQGASA